MSYLPRMSKTYKEPPVLGEVEENISPNTLKPASSLLNEKTYNPQMALRHYRYLPHAPPVLPGPSVLEEALENELFREASRTRRSSSKMETLTKASERLIEAPSIDESLTTLEEADSKLDITEKVKRSHSRKGVKGNKSSLGKKRSSKLVKKDNPSNITVNMCFTVAEKPFTASEAERQSQSISGDSEFLSKHELQLLKREKSIFPVTSESTYAKPQPTVKEKPAEEKPEVKKKEFTNRSVQCTIFGSLSRVFIIPPIINSLLRTLAFLLHEINKEEVLSSSSGERKFPMTQIQLLLGDLCNQKVDKDYAFDVTYSDFKRLEKILGEFQKYMKDVYGDKGEYIDKMEDLKRVFVQSKSKEMELAVLNEKIHEREEKEGEEVVVKEEDLNHPEISLQNKRLESEQLTAEVEFSCREMKKYQKTIAEIDWDIRNYQEQMSNLKKSAGSKSKTEVLGRKASIHKFSSEILARGSKSKDNDNSCRRKT